MLGAPVETITGRLGVGAICFLALYLAADGQHIGVYHLIETYGDSVTFGIVAALPTAVVVYILGVFCVGTADLALSKFKPFREPDPQKILLLSKSGGELLHQSYSETLRNFELLKGSSIAFILLAVGTLLDKSNMKDYETIVVIAFMMALGLCAMSLIFAHRAIAKAWQISDAVGVNEKP